jgi:hypothetical protein
LSVTRAPSCQDELFGVGGDVESDDLASAPHPRNYNAARCGLGRLGRVLGDVASSPRDLGRVERNDRDLATPSNLSAGRLELAFTRSGAHNPFEHRRRALAGRVGSGVAWAVDADDDVEVDNSAPLELRSLHEPNTRDVAEPVARYTELAREPASDGLRSSLPQRRREVVPGSLLVVAVGHRIDRAAEPLVVGRVTLTTSASAVSISDRVDAPERRAVSVTITAGCPATDSGTPLPPRRPQATSWNASER